MNSKDLYTYVNNICYAKPLYKGLKVVVAHSAMRELMKQGKTLYDAVKILEMGYNAPRKRKHGTIEKWLDKGSKTFNAVIEKSYNEILQEECWVLVHLGKFSRGKGK